MRKKQRLEMLQAQWAKWDKRVPRALVVAATMVLLTVFVAPEVFGVLAPQIDSIGELFAAAVVFSVLVLSSLICLAVLFWVTLKANKYRKEIDKNN